MFTSRLSITNLKSVNRSDLTCRVFWGSANLQPAWNCHKWSQRMFLLMKISGGFVLFIVHTLFHTDAITHAHTHPNTLRPISLLWSFYLSKQGASLRDLSKRRVLHSSCRTFRASTVVESLKSEWRTCTHCLFITIYKSAKPIRFYNVLPIVPPRDPSARWAGGPDDCWG